ncbi:thiamine-phosphate kinase [Haloarcula argentinensis]|uniref:Thiamine-monophosphate kinase n=1 Tax=Haloarcula argentinensis TaxID=43776 RepID=A0A830FCP2_HALAR|nr:thiamine-phosphate kinase [Haloarcula argentinensis]EMA22418.1 thiamine-monophosphate kinase [Haloarcula argentinensis DSM 12282]MDS0252270.1 thiamine-phosphate kinase [Haloarcula argentinensis]GGM33689.1 thiamine-monophosphate kinase [Haloarcula argentinensis]
MDERAALAEMADRLPDAGDDCAIVDGQVITTDMLHERTDFPAGTTRYTAGWRAVAASLSDVAAMGAEATAAVAAYGAPSFEADELGAFVDGAQDVCHAVGAEYVGGDLDSHDEFTVASTAIGSTANPVRRSGASAGEVVCVTGTLGQSAAALELFDRGDTDQANELFQFEPRVRAGVALRPHATAMMDSSDGLARSLHQLSEASGCGFAIEEPLPMDAQVDALAETEQERRELGVFFGEDFELVCTLPESDVPEAREAVPCPLHRIGTATERGVTLDGETLPDRGYSH